MSAAEWLTGQLGGAWHSDAGMACCPAHRDRTPSLSVRDGERGVLLRCFAGCTTEAVIAALRLRGCWPVPMTDMSTAHSGSIDTTAVAREIWREAGPIADTIADRYLRRRGITTPLPPSLRYHAHLRHRATGLHFPALVAAVTGVDRRVTAIQRTFLRLDGGGKAGVSCPKMTLGPMSRAAVRLAPAGEILGIAEGIETALSAMQILGIPVWATLGAERLSKIELPPEVRRVIVLGDVGSETAAYKARDAYAHDGRDASVQFPDTGKDFNDQLRAGAVAA